MRLVHATAAQHAEQHERVLFNPIRCQCRLLGFACIVLCVHVESGLVELGGMLMQSAGIAMQQHVGWCSKYRAAASGWFALLASVSHCLLHASTRWEQVVCHSAVPGSRKVTCHCWGSKHVAMQCAASHAVHCSVDGTSCLGHLHHNLGSCVAAALDAAALCT
jgi:hypothetical protein